MMVWGSNTNGELGLGDTQPRIQPTYIDSLMNKQVSQVGLGSAFAFVLGNT
jgi:alpha-tubulin suppressor-like RCC1 family protein